MINTLLFLTACLLILVIRNQIIQLYDGSIGKQPDYVVQLDATETFDSVFFLHCKGISYIVIILINYYVACNYG